MTLSEYLRVLRRQWWLVLLICLLATGGAAAYTFTATPVYTAQTQLFVSVSTAGNDIADLSSGSTFTQARVKSYADVVTSQAVLEQVISELSLPWTADQLADKVTASSPLDTVLLDVSVDDTDPRRAAAVANALAQAFPAFVDQLETPQTQADTQADTEAGTEAGTGTGTGGKAGSPVKISVTKPASVPAAPVSPRIPLNLALGVLVGLGLGVGAAVLRSQLNTSISGVGDVERITGAVPLGVVPYDRETINQPLVGADDKGGRAEAFRTLRTNLQFTDVDKPPRVIVVTSPMPADGKSTTSCNIALTLALSGAGVVLIEGDLRKPALGTYLGLSNAAGLTNVLAGQRDVRDVLVSYQGENLVVLPSGPTPPNPSELLGSTQMSNLIETLSEHFDYVVIDAPPLLPVTDGAVLAAAADGAVLVVRYGRTTRDNLDRAMQSLTAVNAKLLGTVLNFAPRGKRGGYEGYGYGYGTTSAPPVPRQRLPRRHPAHDPAPNLGVPSLLAPYEPGFDPGFDPGAATPPSGHSRGRRAVDLRDAGLHDADEPASLPD